MITEQWSGCELPPQFRYQVSHVSPLLKEQSNCFKFFKISEILVSEEGSYFSYYPCWILQVKNVLFGRYEQKYD